MLKRVKFSLSKIDIFLFIIFLSFSFIIMTKTFRLSPAGDLQIAMKAWSDFAATIPLERSFAYGSNFPPQYPIFAGPPIRYHFVFYFLVALLEKTGLSLPAALNFFSILGFALLLLAIYKTAGFLFRRKSAGIIAVLLFLFNGSFSFLEFFKKHPLSGRTISDILRNDTFPSFGPYDGKTVSAFWNLNIFTNQRHLGLAYAAFLLILFLIYKGYLNPKKFSYKAALAIGLLVGIFPFVHYAVFGMLGILLALSFLLFEKIRIKTLIAGSVALVLALPQILYMGKGDTSVKLFHPGYLVDKLTPENFLHYWLFNLGLPIIFAFIGFLMSDKALKKIFIVFSALFVFGNLFQLSPEIAANHKFFNLFMIGMDMFAAYALVMLWQGSLIKKTAIIVIFPFLILSGFIDLFPVLNDSYITVNDIKNNPKARFILENTPRDSVFLNSSFLYNPASMAGRKIYLGWPYFAWSAGYDTNSRYRFLQEFYSSYDREEICSLLKENGIDYFTVEDTRGNNDYPDIDLKFFDSNFRPVFKDNGFSIYETKANCSQ